MDATLRTHFVERWNRYFPGAEQPLGVYYTDAVDGAAVVPPSADHRCLICQLAPARQGRPLLFDAASVGCGGGRHYLGFAPGLRPGFEYFLSCGIPGEMEGERYKKSPELVRQMLENRAPFEAPGRAIAFTPWERLGEADDPAVVVFFATPDVLSGLFTLANYDEADLQAVIAPMGAGCASIVYHPYQELRSPRPRAVLGLFDVSARPCVRSDELTFAVPWPTFTRMLDNMDESFLITGSWDKVRARLPS